MAESKLNVHITTFNCGRTQVDASYFSSHLLRDLNSTLPPDLLVLSLQEVAPLSYSFLGGSYLAPYYARLTQAVSDATIAKFGSEVDYAKPLVHNVGMTAIMVFTRGAVRRRIRRVETAGVGAGVWDMGNKGAVGVKLRLAAKAGGGQETALTFVSAHLAPSEEAWERRNADWKSICEGLVFERTQGMERTKERIASAAPDQEAEEEPLLHQEHEESTLFSPASYIFFAGDLNYRTADISPKSHPESTNTDEWPQPQTSPSDPRHYTQHLAHDQLTRELDAGKTLHNLAEAPITFPPTYKYSPEAQKAAAHAVTSETRTQADGRTNTITKSMAGEPEEAYLWATHRKPSWCDRILWLAAAPPDVHAYAALPVQPTSDHRPVVLVASVPDKAVEARGVEAPFEVRAGWRERRAAARRSELVVGYAAYLGLTWEGEACVAGSLIGVLGGYVALRALLGAT
nr:isoform 2 of inositol polyphosphate 5-phosphatase ocrl-1 [Quercus suber]